MSYAALLEADQYGDDDDDEDTVSDVKDLRLSDNGNLLVVCSAHPRCVATVWSTVSLTKLVDLWYAGFPKEIKTSAVDIRRTKIVTGDVAGTLCVFTVNGTLLVQKHLGTPVSRVFLSSDESFVVVVTYDDVLVLRTADLHQTQSIGLFADDASLLRNTRDSVCGTFYEDSIVCVAYDLYPNPMYDCLRMKKIDLRTQVVHDVVVSRGFIGARNVKIGFMDETKILFWFETRMGLAWCFCINVVESTIATCDIPDVRQMFFSANSRFMQTWVGDAPRLTSKFVVRPDIPFDPRTQGFVGVHRVNCVSNNGSVSVMFDSHDGKLVVARHRDDLESKLVALYGRCSPVFERFKRRDGDHAIILDVVGFLA